MHNTTQAIGRIWAALDGAPGGLSRFSEQGEGGLPSAFAVSDLASATIGAAGLALSEWFDVNGAGTPAVRVERRLASLWFAFSMRPEGWALPPAWDALAGDYETSDGCIKLHTNAPHHRAAVLKVLDVAGERQAVAAAVSRWNGPALEDAVVAAGGCAAILRSAEDWRTHPQGKAVRREPLVHHAPGQPGRCRSLTFRRERPLAGIRVLDLTRILAGPTATRFLAGFGAEVLRIDPPLWDEPSLAPEVTPGKRCARLDLNAPEGKARFKALLAEADILVSGYRSDALERLGLGAAERQEIRPGLIDVSLDAYGWSGPWAARRGFDSLVQMSTGIAAHGMKIAGTAKPAPLPVQALDHATGYLMAAAALRGLSERATTGLGSRWRTSLAKMAELLSDLPKTEEAALAPAGGADYAPILETTVWGPARRLHPPVLVDGAPMAFATAACPLGSASPEWV